MLNTKSSNIFSEISSFFSEKDDKGAINAIMEISRCMKVTEKGLMTESSDNSKYAGSLVFQLLLLFPFFMVKKEADRRDLSG